MDARIGQLGKSKGKRKKDKRSLTRKPTNSRTRVYKKGNKDTSTTRMTWFLGTSTPEQVVKVVNEAYRGEKITYDDVEERVVADLGVTPMVQVLPTRVALG